MRSGRVKEDSNGVCFINKLPSFLPEEECQRISYLYLNEFLCTLKYYLTIIKEKSDGADEARLSQMLSEYKRLLYKAESLMPSYLPTEAVYDRLLLPIKNKN